MVLVMVFGLSLVGCTPSDTIDEDIYIKSLYTWDGSAWTQLPGTGTGGGSTWYSGSGAPAVGLGTNGDFYLNSSKGDVYTKSGGVWALDTNITGPAGAVGAQGIQGIQGPAGDNGTDGVSIIWIGTYAAAPGSPALNQAYRNSVDGKAYVWNGAVWSEMVQDGSAGAAGAAGQGYTHLGTWNAATSYLAYDCVYYAGSTYVCISAVNSSTSPSSDATHWSLMAKGFFGSLFSNEDIPIINKSGVSLGSSFSLSYS